MMQLKKLVWHIFPANLIVTIGSLLALLWYSSTALEQFHTGWMVSALEDRAYLVEEQVSQVLVSNSADELNAFCRRIGRKASTRITVIDPTGTVVADSDESPDKLANHGDRPEIATAMAGKVGTQLRFSSSIGVKMLYVAIPIASVSPERYGGKFHVLRMSTPVSAIDQTLQSLRVKVGVSGIIVALLAISAAIIVSRRISKPLEEMTEKAELFSKENFSTPITISSKSSLEVGTLATAMNSMAKKLQERFGLIVRQRNELKTILASMADAILVIDKNKQILTLNTSAGRLFEINEENAIGRSTQEIVRNIDIERLVDMTLTSSEAVKEEIILNRGSEKIFLQYNGVHLEDDEGRSFGAVIAFNDVTHIRRLENIRREFVANVSHELMTPLTSIKGYSETILDNGFEDAEQTEKFLHIIIRQSDRLQAIVNDLLELSRLEKEIEYSEIHPRPANVKHVLNEAIQVCSLKAMEKDMSVKLDCPDDLIASMDAQLMEQAVVNLLVNAIKYSDTSSQVKIKAECRTGKNGKEMVSVSVQDFGVGIGREHLPRLFERFYRSDQDRSRKLGGTGLGLAIVKHIAQGHSGSVEVESEVGKGTIFTILIPLTLS